ncbi:MAG: OmpA family protein [Bacteroidales bacterium]|nr:OmpA family protein [Bacteroidales bacterium]
MLKKLFKIGVLACAVSFSCVAFAQTEKKASQQEYPHYGFWSNWSIGGMLDYTHQFGNGMGWKEGSNAGAALLFEKELNHVWALRLSVGMPGIFGVGTDIADRDNDTLGYQNYLRFGAGVKFSINNAIKGYDPDRKNSIYLIANFGAGYNFDLDYTGTGKGSNVFRENNGMLSWFGDFGLGWQHKCCEHSSFFVEATLEDHGDVNKPVFEKSNPHANVFNLHIGIGYLYNFGPTAADRELLNQKKLLTQDKFDELNSQIAALEQDLINSKKNEQRLQNRINELESEVNYLREHQGTANSADADSLQNIINNMKADQTNFYALPFSITYDVNEYQVSEDQMDKLKAIAGVMKDNENAKFNIVGFCDYSGSDAYNMKLSQKRAEQVKKLLVKKYGVKEDQLTTDGKGKGTPFGDVKNGINRRVSFYRVIE